MMADNTIHAAETDSPFTRTDGEALIAQGAFLRFLFAAFQTAGLFDHAGPAQGQSPRDLSFAEGAAAWASICCSWRRAASRQQSARRTRPP